MQLKRSHQRDLATAAMTILLALLVACSGGDDSGPLTAAEAEAVASNALLVIGDLPANDWSESDSQAGLGSLIPSGIGDVDLDILPDACQGLEDAIGNLPALLGDTTPLATAGRSFTATGQLLNLQAVSTTVVVFENVDGAEQAAASLDDALSADNLEGCILAASIPVGDGGGVQIVEFSLSTPSYALADSTALILPINLSVDLHAFQRGNVLALYVGLEINSSALESEHAGLLTTFANRVGEAQN